MTNGNHAPSTCMQTHCVLVTLTEISNNTKNKDALMLGESFFVPMAHIRKLGDSCPAATNLLTSQMGKALIAICPEPFVGV